MDVTRPLATPARRRRARRTAVAAIAVGTVLFAGAAVAQPSDGSGDSRPAVASTHPTTTVGLPEAVAVTRTARVPSTTTSEPRTPAPPAPPTTLAPPDLPIAPPPTPAPADPPAPEEETPAPALLAFAPWSLTIPSGQTTAVVTLTNIGGQPTDWQSDMGFASLFLSASPWQGTLAPGESVDIVLTADRQFLEAGDHQAIFEIQSAAAFDQGLATVGVTVEVVDPVEHPDLPLTF